MKQFLNSKPLHLDPWRTVEDRTSQVLDLMLPGSGEHGFESQGFGFRGGADYESRYSEFRGLSLSLYWFSVSGSGVCRGSGCRVLSLKSSISSSKLLVSP